MAQNYTTPGVYIEEVTGPGVIVGVGTSTAAFIGPALNGPINVAKRITSWDEFTQIYGRQGPSGQEIYIISPRHFLMAHAVHGFFENGGRFAYIVRVGTAAFAFCDLLDQGNEIALRVEALNEGLAGNNTSVEVQHSSLAKNLKASRPSAEIKDASKRRIVVKNKVENFRPGDIITRAGTTERQRIERINYSTNEIFLAGDLVGNYTDGTLQIAELIKGQPMFRLDDTTGLFPGSVVTVARDTNNETATIANVRDEFITLEKGLTKSYLMTGTQVTVTSHEFTLIIRTPGADKETFENLSMNRRHPRYYETTVNSSKVRVKPPSKPSKTKPLDDLPTILAAKKLEKGDDDDLMAIGANQFQNGISALNTVDDVNFICIPDAQDSSIQNDLITHCLNKGDRLAILDVPLGQDPDSALVHRKLVQSERGFAALYYPWLEIRDPSSRNGSRLLIPPSGHIAGIYARVDQSRGVHKAPANENIRGALGLERILTDEHQALLNPEGLNVLRILPGQGQPVVWGARTTVSKDVTDWVYVNVRRLFLYLEESIEEGIRWAVFEPNNLQLWQKLKRTITEFLTRVWRDGALFGEKAEQAFYVRIDEALNPPPTRAIGRLYIEIGVAPVRPAEFIIVRIGLWNGGAEVTES